MALYFQVMIPVTNAIVLMEKSHVPTRSVPIPMLNASQAKIAKTVINVERMAIVYNCRRGNISGHSYFISFMSTRSYQLYLINSIK